MKNIFSSLVGIVSFLVTLGLSRQYPGVFFGLAIVYICFWLGKKYGEGYLKKGHPNTSYLNFIFWSNLVTWFLPFIGGFTAGTTLRINKFNNGNDYFKYQFLAYFGLILSIINAIVGVIIYTKPNH